MNALQRWFRKYFSDPQVVILSVFLLVGFAIIVFLGKMLTPVIAGIIIAFLLDSFIKKFDRFTIGRIWLVILVYTVFLALFLYVLFGLLPLLSQQITQLVQELPNMLQRGEALLLKLPESYPNYFTSAQIEKLIAVIRSEIASFGQYILSISFSNVGNLITIVVYLILMPLLVFFFLKDKQKILLWSRNYYPRDIELTRRVWNDVDRQIGNYVRGKMLEVLIVWIACYIAFGVMGLNYAMLLAALVGLSVIIPYIGAVVVTIPVALIGFYQWGWSPDFAYLMIAYTVIQTIDGTIIVPLLFSEVVNLHPIAIIVSVLVFGGLWGFWGVFFAIPLATLVQAVLTAWPRAGDEIITE
jgi:putative permease